MKTKLLINGELKELTVKEICEEHNKLWQYVVDARKNGDDRSIENVKIEYLKMNRIVPVKNNCFLCEYAMNFNEGTDYPDCDMCPKNWSEEITRGMGYAVLCDLGVNDDMSIYDDYDLPDDEKLYLTEMPINYITSDPSLVLLTEEEILEAIRRDEEYEEKYCK